MGGHEESILYQQVIEFMSKKSGQIWTSTWTFLYKISHLICSKAISVWLIPNI